MPEAMLHVGSGKVRELYALDDERLLLVASDRISTYDVVLPTEIPDKGRVLTGLSGFWFARTAGICANHLIELRPDGRSTECRKLEMLPLECVVRGYLAGSGWKDYQSSGQVSGQALPGGLQESAELPEPLFTPSTKATTGHDENIDRSQAAALIGTDRLTEVERASIALYRFAADHARSRGIRRGRGGHTGALRRSVRAAHRQRLRGLSRQSRGGSAMRATVLVRPKQGILDPQGQAVESSLRQLGFSVGDARVGRVVDLEVDSTDALTARAEVERMCEQLLANPLIESYEIELAEDEG